VRVRLGVYMEKSPSMRARRLMRLPVIAMPVGAPRLVKRSGETMQPPAPTPAPARRPRVERDRRPFHRWWSAPVVAPVVRLSKRERALIAEAERLDRRYHSLSA